MATNEVILSEREFLLKEGLTAMSVSLEKDTRDDGIGIIWYTASLNLEEQGQGHFCFYTDDLELMADVAGKVAEQAMRLRNVCLAAHATAPASSDV